MVKRKMHRVEYPFNIMITILFISSLLSFKIDTANIEIYKKALEHITKSGEYDKLKGKCYRHYVSPEILSFNALGMFFKEELKSYVDLDDKDVVPNIVVVDKEENMLELAESKRAKLKIYFSEMQDNVFFAEILVADRKVKSYSDRPHFGKSYIYMFNVEDDIVNFVDVKEINYN